MSSGEGFLLFFFIPLAFAIAPIIILFSAGHNKKKRNMIEAIRTLKNSMEFTTIDHEDPENIAAIKKTIASFHGLRGIKTGSLNIDHLALKKIDDVSINVVNVSYGRKFKLAYHKLQQTLIILTSEKFQLPVSSLRGLHYWGIYTLGGEDVEASRYFKNYKKIDPIIEIGSIRNSNPAFNLNGLYRLDATEKQLDIINKTLTIDAVKALLKEPFMMVETQKNHLLLMKGTGYEKRIKNALKPAPLTIFTQGFRMYASTMANGYLTGDNAVDTVNEAIRLGQQFKNIDANSAV